MMQIETKPIRNRPRPQIVNLSDAAADRIKEIMSKSEMPFLRVGVKNGGCAGMEYVLEYASSKNDLDEVVNDKGVQILIAAEAILFLIGTTIDIETTKLHSKFVFKNPNQTDACGCGESVTIEPFKN